MGYKWNMGFVSHIPWKDGGKMVDLDIYLVPAESEMGFSQRGKGNLGTRSCFDEVGADDNGKREFLSHNVGDKIKSALDPSTKTTIFVDLEKGKDESQPEQLLALKRGHDMYGFLSQKWTEVLKDPVLKPILSDKSNYELSHKWTRSVRFTSLVPVVSPLVCQGEHQLQMAQHLDRFFILKEQFLEGSKINPSMRKLPPHEPLHKDIEAIMISRHLNPDAKMVAAFFSALSKLDPTQHAFHKLCLVNLEYIKVIFRQTYTELRSQMFIKKWNDIASKDLTHDSS